MTLARTRRRAAAVAVLCALAVLAAGCEGSYSREPSKANVAESESIVERLARLPGVVRVDGGYSYNLQNPGSFSVSFRVRRRTSLRPVADKAIEWAWRSRLPISAIGVVVGLYDDPRVTHDRNLVLTGLTQDKAALTRRYGPRPPSRER